MSRNWGLPKKLPRGALVDTKIAKPLLTLFVSGVFGVIGAAIAVLSFAAARTAIAGLFQGQSLIAAILAAGFGCWFYIWLARPRFAAQFGGQGDIFHRVLRFYVIATLSLSSLFLLAVSSGAIMPGLIEVFLFCLTGGAAAAAAFQTVLAFVPHYEEDPAADQSGNS